jgi:hypothetical protein
MQIDPAGKFLPIEEAWRLAINMRKIQSNTVQLRRYIEQVPSMGTYCKLYFEPLLCHFVNHLPSALPKEALLLCTDRPTHSGRRQSAG